MQRQYFDGAEVQRLGDDVRLQLWRYGSPAEARLCLTRREAAELGSALLGFARSSDGNELARGARRAARADSRDDRRSRAGRQRQRA